ncbi:MAG: calcium-binding protein, partial [Planctomycetota bacterium]
DPITQAISLNTDSLVVNFNADFGDLEYFSDFSGADIGSMLADPGGLGAFITGLAGWGAMDLQLPVINRSFADLLRFATVFDEMVADQPSWETTGLEALESTLEADLGLDPGDVALSLDFAGAAKALRLDLVYGVSTPDGLTLPMNLDLSSLGVPGLSRLMDVHSQGELTADADITLSLALGVDLSDPANPRPFVYDGDTGITATLFVQGDVAFEASVGALGVFIGKAGEPAVVAVDADGSGASTSPAEFSITIDDNNGDGRHYLDEAIVDDLALADAPPGRRADLVLPVFYPTQDQYLDGSNHNLEVTITDLADPATFQVAAQPDFGGVISGMDLSTTMDALIGGWEGLMKLLEDVFQGEVLGVDLPLVGDKLTEASLFIRKLRENVVSALAEPGDKTADFVKQKFYEALGPGGLDWLGDWSADGQITPDDVDMIVGADDVAFQITLAGSPVLHEEQFDLDMAVPGLGLDKADGEVSVEVGFELDLGFGVSRADGVYFDVSAADDLTVFFEAQVEWLEAQFDLLLLQVDAQTMDTVDLTQEERDKTDGVVNAFRGEFTIDITDPSGDGRLTLAELAAGPSVTDIIHASLDADASIHMDLLASMDGTANFPSVGAELHLYWAFGATTDYKAKPPEIVFSDVRLNVGEFFTSAFGGALEVVDNMIEPFRPILDVLTARLPVISDLMGQTVTVVDLARLFGMADVADFIEAADTIADLMDVAGVGDNLWINLGGFSLTWNNGTPVITEDADAQAFDLLSAISGLDDRDLSDYFNSTQRLNDGAGGLGLAPTYGPGDRLQLPLLTDPTYAFQLLVGRQDVPLILYDFPALELRFSYSQYFPVFGPLGARITGSLGMSADFALGYDTQGIFDAAQSGKWTDVFNGFYLSDRENADGTGSDVAELTFSGSLTAAAELNILVASAGVEGGIYATVDFNLNDPNNDGKVRADELASNFALGPVYVFDVSGKIEAGLSAYIKVDLLLGKWEESWDIARVKLVDFELDRPDPEAPIADPVLATLVGDELYINIGPRAGEREPGAVDGDEVVLIESGNTPDEVVVKGFGTQARYSGVARIIADGGAGSDVITVDDDVELPAELRGGTEDDVITAGDGPSILHGDDGEDRLTGGDADDEIYGGENDDIIYSGFGDDVVDGGGGADEIDGGGGDDELTGGSGDDYILGGPGYDTIRGGEDNDHLYGEEDADLIYGEDGDDVLSGEESQDTLEGGNGNDSLDGGGGNDILRGGDGTDLLNGGAGNDELYGGLLGDELYGGLGSD